MRGPGVTVLRVATVLVAIAWLHGCGEPNPTSLGSDLRNPPDTLRVGEITTVDVDTVFPIPTALGRSPAGQIGRRIAYTSHILYAFRIPTRVVQDSDTLLLDELDLTINGDSVSIAPFEGSMRIGLMEIEPGSRDWDPDSVMTELPPLEPDALAPDTVLVGDDLIDRALRLRFILDLTRTTGYDSALVRGDSLEVHVALVFKGFETMGAGFLEVSFLRTGGESAQLVAFAINDDNAFASVGPTRRVSVVQFDPMYDPGTKIVVSDGAPLHSYLRFAPQSEFIPDSALVHRAELILTQVESADGASFGTGPVIGVIVPTDSARLDSTRLFEQKENIRPLAFSTPIVATEGATTVIDISPYYFDIQEGSVMDRGMLLRLSNRGTKARHFEFYGGAEADVTRRPRVRIVYSLPADFEGGEN